MKDGTRACCSGGMSSTWTEAVNQPRVGRDDGAEQCGRPAVRASLAYHLAVGEEGDVREGLRHAVEVGGAAVAHVRVEHGLGDVLGVVPVLPVELVLQVVDAVLFLVSRDARAPCKKTTACERQGGSGGIGQRGGAGRGDLPLRRLKRVLHCGQFCVPSRRSYS
jgi:hypothetical protein